MVASRLVYGSAESKLSHRDVMRIYLEFKSWSQDITLGFPHTHTPEVWFANRKLLWFCTLLLELTCYYSLSSLSAAGFLGNNTEFGRWSSARCTTYFFSYTAFPTEAKISCYPSSSPCQLSIANTCKFKNHDFLLRICCLSSEFLLFTWFQFFID